MDNQSQPSVRTRPQTGVRISRDRDRDRDRDHDRVQQR
jgi:hypothetical protein